MGLEPTPGRHRSDSTLCFIAALMARSPETAREGAHHRHGWSHGARRPKAMRQMVDHESTLARGAPTLCLVPLRWAGDGRATGPAEQVIMPRRHITLHDGHPRGRLCANAEAAHRRTGDDATPARLRPTAGRRSGPAERRDPFDQGRGPGSYDQGQARQNPSPGSADRTQGLNLCLGPAGRTGSSGRQVA